MKYSLQRLEKGCLLAIGALVSGLLCWILYISFRKPRQTKILPQLIPDNEANANESGEPNAKNPSGVGDQPYIIPNIEQQALEPDFLTLGQELRQVIGVNIDQELSQFLSSPISAMLLPKDTLKLCAKSPPITIKRMAKLLQNYVSFFNHIPLDNDAAIDIALAILNMFIKVNKLELGAARVRDIVWMGYAERNPVFTNPNLTIDDYLKSLRRLIHVFHPNDKFNHFYATNVVVNRWFHQTTMAACINSDILNWVRYCCGRAEKPMKRVSSAQAPNLILEEFKLLKFFLSFEDQSQVISQRVEEIEDSVPRKMENAHHEWLSGGWKVVHDGNSA